MKITKKQLIHEIADRTGYTLCDIEEVFRVMQRLILTHMKNMDEVQLFNGLNLSGVIKKGHRHHSEYGGDFDIPDYVGPRVTFSQGLRYYLRGIKGYRDYDEQEQEESGS